MLSRWRDAARALRRDVIALSLAMRDPRVSWLARGVGFLVIAYALSPLDLVPDFIPVLGYLDDLLIVPAGILLVRRLVPAEVLEEHRQAADGLVAQPTAAARVGLALVLLTWLLLLAVVLWFAF